MGSRIVPTDEPTRQRQPRERAPDHLAFIRRLPCVVCFTRRDIHAAHIRAAAIQYGKGLTGKGEKPDDRWSFPLCAEHHVFGPDAQHKMGEIKWFQLRSINPFVTALALWACSGNDALGETIVHRARDSHVLEGDET